MSFKSILLKFILALPGVIFGFWYFAPPPADGGKDWFKFGVFLLMTPLSAIAGVVSLIVAIKERRNIAWWLIAA